MKNIQKGFTLIELMIVVAIIAILAAIALPAYQDYVARSQVSEAATLSAGAKTAVTEEYANTTAFTGIDNTTAGLAAAGSIQGKYVTQVAVADGVITATMGNEASTKVATYLLVYSPIDQGGAVAWNCNPTAGTTIDPKYLPSVCRN